MNAGCFAIGMDIDHSFDFKGNYDTVLGLPMKAMTSELAGVMTATGVHNLDEFDPSVIHRVL